MLKSRVSIIGYIGLFLIFVLLASSCATESWDFIGTWNLQPDKLTYTNADQHIKVTFPNDKWVVYTKPTKPNEHFKQQWKNPWGAEDSSYMVLLAFYPDWPGHDVSMYFYVAPVLGHNPWIEDNTGLEQYLVLMTKMHFEGGEKRDYKVIQRKGRKIGVLRHHVFGRGDRISFFFKEKRRFSTIFFEFSGENLFESNKNQFWAIADSYEYIE